MKKLLASGSDQFDLRQHNNICILQTGQIYIDTTVMAIQLPSVLQINQLFDLPNQIKLNSCSEVESKNSQLSTKAKILIQSHIPVAKDTYYPDQFVNKFIIIKLNSLARKQCDVSENFLLEFAKLYKSKNVKEIVVSQNESQITSQLLLLIQPNRLFLAEEQLENILQGNALLATSAVWLLESCQKYLKKEQFAFCLSFVALGGRQLAFIPIVHQQKNHAGQILFAKRISELFHVNKKVSKQEIKVQDPYSMRCSPQVHGIAYDCMKELNQSVSFLINRPHFKYIRLGDRKVQNILTQSENYSLKLDYMICCLQQIGAMSLLRTERILNCYLGKNNIQSHQTYPLLSAMLSSCTGRASSNKILCQYTNFDSCNIHNYDKDIFYNAGQYYTKIQTLMSNLYFIMNAMRDKEEGKVGTVEFLNKQMAEWVDWIQNKVSVWDRSGSLQLITHEWQV